MMYIKAKPRALMLSAAILSFPVTLSGITNILFLKAISEKLRYALLLILLLFYSECLYSQPGFVAGETDICNGTQILFWFTSEANPEAGYTWDFGPLANPSEFSGIGISAISVLVTYPVAGRYSVSLTENSETGIKTTTLIDYIKVYPNTSISLSSVPGSDLQAVCNGNPIATIDYSLFGLTVAASVSGLPPGLNVNQSDNHVVIEGSPVSPGIYDYEIYAYGPCGNDTKSGTITVYATPVISDYEALTVCEGSTKQLTASSDPALSDPWISDDTSVATIEDNGRVTGIAAGTCNIIFTDIYGCTGTSAITVKPLPPAPEAGSNSPVTGGGTISLGASIVTDATYFWTGPNGFSSPGQYVNVPGSATNAMEGTYSVTATVNGCTGPAGTTDVIVNFAPVITEGAFADLSCDEDAASATIILHVTDEDGDPVSWAINRDPWEGTAEISGTGGTRTVSYSPNGNFYGYDSFELIVTDSYGLTDFITVNVAVNAVNDPPVVVGPVSDQQFYENFYSGSVDISGVFNDIEHDILTLTAVSSKESVVTVSVVGTTLLIIEAGPGVSNITLTANDGSLNVSDEFTVTVYRSSATISTTQLTSVKKTAATGGGNITDEGVSPVTARGVCWSTNPGPTAYLETRTTDGTGTGTFTSIIEGLIPGTTYYLRAYATNSFTTSYGEEISFTTYNPDAVPDIDDNYYNVITIGSQVWMTENLKSTHYNDGSSIPLVTDNALWEGLATPGYSWYNNDEATYKATYGALYNWYAVDPESNGGKNVCPDGWHVPSDIEWTTLTTYLGGEDVAGGKLKETGVSYWTSPNSDATNESGFTALPAGARKTDGVSGFIGGDGHWWCSAGFNINNAWLRYISYNWGGVARINADKNYGLSVRCLLGNNTEQSITLTEGWNLLSFTREPSDKSALSIVDALRVADVLVKVQDETGRAIERLSTGWINGIGEMSVTEGYKMRVTEETNLIIAGEPVSLPLDIPLVAGWNIIGYPSENSQAAEGVFGTLALAGTLVKVQDDDGNAIEKIGDTWIYGITSLEPGNGYSVKVSSNADLTIGQGAKGEVVKRENEKSEPVHFRPAYAGKGLDHMNIYVGRGEPPSLKLRWPKEGDEIGVFDGDICVGAVVVEGGEDKYIRLTASFDDPVTAEKDGFTKGNTLELRLWDRETGEETELKDLEPITGYDLAFERQGTTVLKRKTQGEVVSWLGDAYPNPSSEKTTFTFRTAEECRVRLEVFDVMGNKIMVLVDETRPGGYYQTEWDNKTGTGNKVKSGLYFYRLRLNELSQVKQLVIQ